MGQSETGTEQETLDLACSSDENWVNEGVPATGYSFPNTASLAGKWADDSRNSVIFDCVLDISDSSFGNGSTALTIQGRIEAGRHD